MRGEGGGVWQELYSVAYRFLRRRGVQEADAQDLAQEALLVALQHADAVDPGRLHAWIRVVARNQLVSRLRREARAGVPAELSEDLAVASADDPEAEVIRALEREQLDAVLARLAARPRQLLQMRYVEGLSIAEISASLGGAAPNAVKVSLYRARKLLRAAYEEVVEP